MFHPVYTNPPSSVSYFATREHRCFTWRVSMRYDAGVAGPYVRPEVLQSMMDQSYGNRFPLVVGSLASSLVFTPAQEPGRFSRFFFCFVFLFIIRVKRELKGRRAWVFLRFWCLFIMNFGHDREVQENKLVTFSI